LSITAIHFIGSDNVPNLKDIESITRPEKGPRANEKFVSLDTIDYRHVAVPHLQFPAAKTD